MTLESLTDEEGFFLKRNSLSLRDFLRKATMYVLTIITLIMIREIVRAHADTVFGTVF